MNKKDALNPLADTSNKELLDNLCKWIDDNLDSNIGLAELVVQSKLNHKNLQHLFEK